MDQDHSELTDGGDANGISSRTRAFSSVMKPARRSLGPTRRRLIQFAWLGGDVLAMAVAIALACLLLGRVPDHGAHYILFAGMIAVRLAIFVRIGMYRAVLRYSGIHTLACATGGVAVGSLFAVTVAAFLYWQGQAELGRGFWVLEGLLSLFFCGGTRLAGRMILERFGNNGGQRVLVYGAGSLGELVVRNLARTPGYKAVGFIDDDPRLRDAIIHGKTVHGDLSRFAAIADKTRAELVIAAISDLSPDSAQRLFRLCMDRGLRVLVAKGVISAFDQDGKTGLGLRELAFEDLLRRPSRDLDPLPVKRMLAGRRVLVTGAGGSIGSELCRQIAEVGVERIDLLDHSEYNLYAIHAELREMFPQVGFETHLVSLVDQEATSAVLHDTRPEVVFHAAAYKHVPLVEENPFEGVKNNVRGFLNLIEAAEDAEVDRLVLISTDKAVRPTNIMGATKRVCELILESRPPGRMKRCAVRFGNVLGSSGSVIPHFIDQIGRGGPVTVTHPEVTRYFMLIPEAVSLVLQAGARCGDDPEIFILDMGEPARIVDLARQLIFMHGYRPDVDIKIVYSGLRPGEKLYEELLTDDVDHHTDIPGITVAKMDETSSERMQKNTRMLLQACAQRDVEGLVLSLKTLVGEWDPSAVYAKQIDRAGVVE